MWWARKICDDESSSRLDLLLDHKTLTWELQSSSAVLELDLDEIQREFHNSYTRDPSEHSDFSKS